MYRVRQVPARSTSTAMPSSPAGVWGTLSGHEQPWIQPARSNFIYDIEERFIGNGRHPATYYVRKARSARGDGERPWQRADLGQGRNSHLSKSQVCITSIALDLSDAQKLIWMQARHIGFPLGLCDRAMQRLLALGFKRAHTRARETLAHVTGDIPIRRQLAISSLAHSIKIRQCQIQRFLPFCGPVTCPPKCPSPPASDQVRAITSDRHRMRCLARTSRCHLRSGLAISFLSSIDRSRLGAMPGGKGPQIANS